MSMSLKYEPASESQKSMSLQYEPASEPQKSMNLKYGLWLQARDGTAVLLDTHHGGGRLLVNKPLNPKP